MMADTVSRNARGDTWDRVNFRRVLRRLRTEAGLSQVELGERMGRDRRRVMVLEQGLAVRKPGITEIGLFATALGGGAAGSVLAMAAHSEARTARFSADTSPRERVQRQLASDFNRLLCSVDGVRDEARRLVRGVDQLFDEWPVADEVVRRSCRTIASTVASVLDELHFETGLLHQHLTGSTPMPDGKSWVDLIVEFREAQSRHWSRCTDDVCQVVERAAPDQIDRYLDILELGSFHRHAGVSEPATTALQALAHVFLFWAELALPVASDFGAWPRNASRMPSAGQPRGTSVERLLIALQTFEKLPLPQFAEQLTTQVAPQPAGHALEEFVCMWGKLNEDLLGLLPADASVEGLRRHCLVS